MTERLVFNSVPQTVPAESKAEIKREPTTAMLVHPPKTDVVTSVSLPSEPFKQEEEEDRFLNNGKNSKQFCCLVENGKRCSKLSGNASYSKRIQKTVAQKKLKLNVDESAKHNYICDHHKNVIQSIRSKRRRKDSDDESGETDNEVPEVDLYQLQVNTLRRYKKHFKVSSRPGLNKAQLTDCLMRHFKTIPVVEKEALTFFIYMVKANKSRLEHNERRETETD